MTTPCRFMNLKQPHRITNTGMLMKTHLAGARQDEYINANIAAEGTLHKRQTKS